MATLEFDNANAAELCPSCGCLARHRTPLDCINDLRDAYARLEFTKQRPGIPAGAADVFQALEEAADEWITAAALRLISPRFASDICDMRKAGHNIEIEGKRGPGGSRRYRLVVGRRPVGCCHLSPATSPPMTTSAIK